MGPPPQLPTVPPPMPQHFHTWSLTQGGSDAQPQPVPWTPGPKAGTKRLPNCGKLSSNDHLLLMGHVCDHRGDYSKGKMAFWKIVSELFEEDTARPLKEPRLAVANLIENRKRQLAIEASGSGVKLGETELTKRIDLWQQYLQDVKKVNDDKAASKAEQAERRKRTLQLRDELLFGPLENANAEAGRVEVHTIDSSDSEPSQRPAVKRRRRHKDKDKDIKVRVEMADGLSKKDWMDIMAVGAKNDSNAGLRQEINALGSKIDLLGSNLKRTHDMMQQLLLSMSNSLNKRQG